MPRSMLVLIILFIHFIFFLTPKSQWERSLEPGTTDYKRRFVCLGECLQRDMAWDRIRRQTQTLPSCGKGVVLRNQKIGKKERILKIVLKLTSANHLPARRCARLIDQ